MAGVGEGARKTGHQQPFRRGMKIFATFQPNEFRKGVILRVWGAHAPSRTAFGAPAERTKVPADIRGSN